MQDLKASETPLICFGRLWGLAELFHLAGGNEWGNSVFSFVSAIAAVLLVTKPTLGRLLLLAGAQTFYIGEQLPFSSNHSIFSTFINLGILASAGYLVLSEKSFQIDWGKFCNSFFPLARISLLILYFFAVFHKLNQDFFDPEISCGAQFISFWMQLVPDSQHTLVAYVGIGSTLLIELVIPILLCLRKTRLWGILIGCIFHGALGLTNFYNFSAMLYALYFLFLPDTVMEDFANHWVQTSERLKQKYTNWKYSAKNLIIFFGCIFFSLLLLGLLHEFLPVMYVVFFWGVYATTFTISIYRVARKRDLTLHKMYTPASKLLYAVPVLVFLNAMCPYLGLKTESSLAMYSNLSTEQGITNHYLIPSSWQIFPYQQDYIEIIETNSNWLQKLVDKRCLIHPFELRRILSEQPPDTPIQFRYRQNGNLFDQTDAFRNPDLSAPISFLEKKFFHFRIIDIDRKQRCRH